MEHRRTILFLIPHFGGGGAERVAALVACGLNPARYDVHVGLVTQRKWADDDVPQWIRVHGLGARRVRYGAWALLRLIWKLRPDVVLSGMAHLNKLVLFLRPLFPRATRVLVRQNGTPAADNGPGSWKLYPRADAVICQTLEMAAEVASVAGGERKMRVLPNPIDVDAIRAEARQPVLHWTGPGPHVLAVGRLAGEKCFDVLLQAFAELRREFPQADVAILGEGRERPALEMLAWVLGLVSAVRLPGHVEHPPAWFPGATLFVLPSRHEGLPNALLEAAAGGLPIVTTQSSPGLADLVTGREGVWLVGKMQPDELARALKEAVQAARKQPRYSHAWVNAFRMDEALAEYEALIEEQFAGAAR